MAFVISFINCYAIYVKSKCNRGTIADIEFCDYSCKTVLNFI